MTVFLPLSRSLAFGSMPVPPAPRHFRVRDAMRWHSFRALAVRSGAAGRQHPKGGRVCAAHKTTSVPFARSCRPTARAIGHKSAAVSLLSPGGGTVIIRHTRTALSQPASQLAGRPAEAEGLCVGVIHSRVCAATNWPARQPDLVSQPLASAYFLLSPAISSECVYFLCSAEWLASEVESESNTTTTTRRRLLLLLLLAAARAHLLLLSDGSRLCHRRQCNSCTVQFYVCPCSCCSWLLLSYLFCWLAREQESQHTQWLTFNIIQVWPACGDSHITTERIVVRPLVWQ